jgi:general secretion pathway protein E
MKDKKRPKLGEILVERGIISAEDLAKALGAQMDIPCVNPALLQIEPEALRLVSEAIARQHNLIPVAVNDDVMQLAVADADDVLVLDALNSRTRKKIVPMIATAEEISKAIDDNYCLQSVGEAEPAEAPLVPENENLEHMLSGLGITDSPDLETAADTLAYKKEELENLFTHLDPVAVPEAEATVSTLDKPGVDLNTCSIQTEALKLIPEGIARKCDAIPIGIVDNTLQVAVPDADDISALEALTAWARMRIAPVIADREDIRRAIDRNYKAYGEIEKQFSTADYQPAKEEKLAAENVANAPVVRALDLLIKEAIKNHASDIHIEPTENSILVRYRIDGVLHEAMTLPLSAQAPLISRIKIMANMNIADQRRPQDGQFSIMVQGRKVDLRVATIFTAYGEMAVLRILDNSFAELSLDELGFSKGNLEVYGKMLKSPFGMILISGPTGSGKTTTLYASLKSLDCKGRKIITVEDPVEYRYQDINQVQINPRAGLTFATGLRAIMRLDPDVILVGEIRDPETAEIAVQAALTGHLVMASIHANDAVGAIYRLLDLGVPPYLASSSLAGSIAQRMVRRICPNCRDFAQAPVEARLAYCRELDEERAEFYYGRGCNSCASTGYQGRVAVFEMLTMSDEIRTRLLASAGSAQIRAQARQEGMSSMWHDGMLKVKAGVTTPSEILRNVSCSD